MRTADTSNGYGWISIALHWMTAAIVFAMFVIGTMSQGAGREESFVQHVLRAVHGYVASFIVAGIILHVLAVFKHVVLDRDGTFDKIMIAGSGRHDRLAAAGRNKA